MERFIQLNAVGCVDFIYLYETEDDLLKLLNIVSPDVRFIGEDYKNNNYTGDDLNIEIYYTKRYGYSTTGLRQRIKGETQCQT
tara:strand:+ start:258 stop:506 length:249 start_codon:yes stop_codon:yes gene_type:complete